MCSKISSLRIAPCHAALSSFQSSGRITRDIRSRCHPLSRSSVATHRITPDMRNFLSKPYGISTGNFASSAPVIRHNKKPL